MRQRRLFRRTSQGSVAVEMAIITPIFLLLLSVPIFYARVFWYYSVAEKAAHDAARYLSSVTPAEMQTTGTGFDETKIVAVARWIAQEELREIVPATDGVPIDIICQPGPCGSVVPNTVQVRIAIAVHDQVLGDLWPENMPASNLVLHSDVTMRYVGM